MTRVERQILTIFTFGLINDLIDFYHFQTIIFNQNYFKAVGPGSLIRPSRPKMSLNFTPMS